MLIKAYGQFWNPDIVDWGRRGQGNKGNLLGRTKIKGRNYDINYWDAKGIYVLHADFKTVYVGQANDGSIGKRLRDHLTDRFMGRWDMFSWFSISNPSITKSIVSVPGQRQLGPQVIIDTLEAIGILIADPALNRKREKFKSAYEAFQPQQTNIRSIRSYLEEILAEVSE